MVSAWLGLLETRPWSDTLCELPGNLFLVLVLNQYYYDVGKLWVGNRGRMLWIGLPVAVGSCHSYLKVTPVVAVHFGWGVEVSEWGFKFCLCQCMCVCVLFGCEWVCVCLCVCMRESLSVCLRLFTVCMRAFVHSCVHACLCACVCMQWCVHFVYLPRWPCSTVDNLLTQEIRTSQ